VVKCNLKFEGFKRSFVVTENLPKPLYFCSLWENE